MQDIGLLASIRYHLLERELTSLLASIFECSTAFLTIRREMEVAILCLLHFALIMTKNPGLDAPSFCHCRAVSLAGEADRKLLKEIVKDAPCPVKARVIPQGEFASSCSPMPKYSDSSCNRIGTSLSSLPYVTSIGGQLLHVDPAQTLL